MEMRASLGILLFFIKTREHTDSIIGSNPRRRINDPNDDSISRMLVLTFELMIAEFKPLVPCGVCDVACA